MDKLQKIYDATIEVDGIEVKLIEYIASLAFNFSIEHVQKDAKCWINSQYEEALWYTFETDVLKPMRHKYLLAIYSDFNIKYNIKINDNEGLNVGYAICNQYKIFELLKEKVANGRKASKRGKSTNGQVRRNGTHLEYLPYGVGSNGNIIRFRKNDLPSFKNGLLLFLKLPMTDAKTKTFAAEIIETLEKQGYYWARQWLTEKPTIVHFECDGSCGTLIEDYNKNRERCVACPTPKRKYRKVK